jgi:nucleoside-diphosphate-sugar epimerase
MKVMVSGASGFIGLRVCEALAQRGHTVHALTHRRHVVARNVAESHPLTGGLDGLLEIYQRVRPHATIHLATHYARHHSADEIDALIQANVSLGTQLLEAASATRCDVFVNAASSWQFDHVGNPTPRNLYAATKAAFQQILESYTQSGLRSASLVIYDTYGPNDTRGKIVQRLLEAAGSGNRLEMSTGHQRLAFVAVDDVANGFALAVEGLSAGEIPSGRFWRLSDGRLLSLRQLAEKVAAASGERLLIDWGARPAGPREPVEPWLGIPVLPGWSQRGDLDCFLHQTGA